ncbi:MAG: Succinate-semialdehyde dehydrogenase [NADP(+)] [Pseudoclavibacter caeni]|jgi:succinate-semialdehyde dehydrogenase/glutarate-semialdehyde dehydrogenase
MTTQTFTSINPASGEAIAEYPIATDQAIDAAAQRSLAAQRTWRDVPVADRAQVLARTAELYRERRDELARTIAREMGKPITQALGEIAVTADIFAYYASDGPGMLAPRTYTPHSGGTATVLTQPIGPLLGIMPWNYPHYQVARFAAPNLLLGNSILLKHARDCPASALAIADLLAEAGLPEGLYVNLFATHDQVTRLIEGAVVRGVSLTGSERAGARVAAVAGRSLKKVVLELGGSDPFIVLDGHDLDRTVHDAVSGRFSNAGQACTSPKRIIIVDAVYDRFVERFRQEAARLVPGDPLDVGTALGPLSSTRARADVLAQVRDTVAAGASLLVGGAEAGVTGGDTSGQTGESGASARTDESGAWLPPIVLADVRPGMRAWDEELFGPVALLYRVADADAAVTLANTSPYGLGAAVYTADAALARSVAERLEVGMVTINGNSDSEPDLPFGGVKRSGFGRELGIWGILEFSNQKLIRVRD